MALRAAVVRAWLEAGKTMLSTRRIFGITAFAGVAGSMLGFVTLNFNLHAALAGLAFPVVFTLLGAFFVLVPSFFALRYSLRLSPLASCAGVFGAGTIAGWLALGVPSEDLFGLTGDLGARFGACTAGCWIIFYYLITNDTRPRR